MKRTVLTSVVLTGALLASACGHQAQYSSGNEYLARHVERLEKAPKVKGQIPQKIDEKFIRAASVEPDLQFPGRFGLARIVNGRLSNIPESEVAAWTGLAGKLSGLGSFVPISPLIAELASSNQTFEHDRWRPTPLGETIEKIRLGAARQHVDAVLIYEVGARAGNSATAFALADITLIGGAFLPTREITAEGRASAMFVDVLNGYPYGTTTASVDLSSYYISWGSDRKTEQKRNEAAKAVVDKLIPEVEKMILKVRQLATDRKQT